MQFKLLCKKIFVLVLILSATFWRFGLFNFAAKHLAIPKAQAATSGQTILYMHKEPSDAIETYNSLSLTPPEPAADTASGFTSKQSVSDPPTSLCESVDNTGETFNRVNANGGQLGINCMASFISPPVGTGFTIGAHDANAVSANIWTTKTNTTDTTPVKIYIYKWDGATLTLFKTFTGSNFNDTNIDQTSFALSSTDNASPITVAATDRIVAIVALNNAGPKVSGGSNIGILFDSTARAASQVTLKYTFGTANTPVLTDPKSDDFTVGLANTACSTAGTTFNTKWTCTQGTATNSAGFLNDEDLAATGGGDESGWLQIQNKYTAGLTPSNFGTTPSNTFIWQPTTSGYTAGDVQTVVNSTLAYTVGGSNPASPYSHAGLVFWASNTDYYELQLYSDAAKGTASTAKVAFVSNSGGTVTFIATAAINNPVSNDEYNQIWLGFDEVAGVYQAQYSVDGLNWINLGATQNHANFARVGLNVFNGISGQATSYTGAFDWFYYALTNMPATGTVTSTTIDTAVVSNGPAYNSIMWNGSTNGSTGKVRFQIATSASSTGPWSFIGGATCSSGDWYAPSGPGVPIELTCADSTNQNNNRYVRYNVQICSGSDCVHPGKFSPIVTEVDLDFSP